MSEKIATRLAAIACESGVIPDEDRDLYIYSYQIVFERIVSWACLVLVALFFETLVPYALVFMAFYLSLSMFTGGWHAPSFGLCFLVSVGIFVGFSLVEPFIAAVVSSVVMLAVILCCAVIIALLGPAEHPNKPMDAGALKRCRKVSLVILAVQVALATGVFVLENERVLVFMTLSFALVSLSLVGDRKTAEKSANNHEGV